MEFGLLVSGGLGEKCLSYLYIKYTIRFVLTDKKSVEIKNFCSENNIPCYSGNPRNEDILSFLKGLTSDYILSINYIFLINKYLINFPRVCPINFHGSLLPKYRGRTPHVWAIINDEKETGVTAHIIDEGCDTGSIIAQRKITIDDFSTGGGILEKYNEIYPDFIDEVIQTIKENRVILISQDESIATYFSKRTPDDGLIDWNWQKRRIYNWVRALTRPYPGAFTYYNGIKIKIYGIVLSEFVFKEDFPNGYILNSDKSPIIKTPDGAIKLIDWEADAEIMFKQGEVFDERC